jgi:RimJ/RimL family protein N-acetyltransferase
MEFRMADYKDIDSIMNIIFKAQENFRSKKIDQWQNNYPNYDIIREDIKNKNSYVLLKDGVIIGTVYLSFDGEPTYEKIYKGQWLSNRQYAVIHRMAVDSEYKGLGLASLMMKYMEDICLNKNIHSIKVDTHSENLSMQKSLEKNGYKYCGIIYLEDGNERVAFEKLLLN